MAVHLVQMGQAKVTVREYGDVRFAANGTAFVEATVEVPVGTVVKSADELLAAALEE